MPSPSERVIAGRYRLRRQLGRGAMGIVWEAYDEFLRRPVSVKEVLLQPGIPQAEADELRERTLREARAIAALSHPNVITLHDVAREDGEPFVVTEYLLAHSLAVLVRVLGPLEVSSAAAVGDAVAAGLAAAHQSGITHRDVKPGNVLIGVAGQVKLTDFGIARNVSEHTLTRTGIMLGSPAYIAPEVAAGREVTPAADLWGLGATLFAVVEGRPPYDADGTALDTVNQVVHGEVPRPSDGPLREVIAALMMKDPAERISLAELRNRLHPLLPPPSTPLLSAAEVARLDAAAGLANAAAAADPANAAAGAGPANAAAAADPNAAAGADQANAPATPGAEAAEAAAQAEKSPARGGPPDFQPSDEHRQFRGPRDGATGDPADGGASAGAAGDSVGAAGGVSAGADALLAGAGGSGAPLADAPGSGTPLASSPGGPGSPSALASVPGPLPFGVTVRRRVPRRRGAQATSLLVVLSVVLFCAAAGGGFALARHLGGEPLLPPQLTKTTPTTPANAPKPGALETQTGDAATVAGAQGGGYQISVPRGWVRFVEERVGNRLPNSTVVYFVSPDGTQTVTIQRLPRFYPDHDLKTYVTELSSAAPDVSFDVVEQVDIPGLAGAPGSPEPAQHLSYRTTTDAKSLVPRDGGAQNLNRVTFANLLPSGNDLWVVSVTVPIEQEDSGEPELFDKIAPGFQVTG